MRLVSSLLVLIITSAACAPVPATQVPASTEISQAPTAALPALAPVDSASPNATALPIATSRGPGLHATDPATVSLASGGLQLIEFFRFT
jgi:hypothetical protein